MGDAQPAPGWWQASDGEWYAAQQHPDASYRARWSGTGASAPADLPGASAVAGGGRTSATVTGSGAGARRPAPGGLSAPPPPVPPTAAAPAPGSTGQAGVIGRRTEDRRFVVRDAAPPSRPGSGELARRVLVGVLSVAVLVGVGVGAYILAGGGGDGIDEPDPPATTAEGDPRDIEDDTTSVSEAPGELVEVLVGDRLSVTFPGDWAVTEPGVGPTAQELFPDDSAAAAVFDQNLSQQDEGSLVFAADRDSFDGGVLTSMVASFVTYGEGAGFDSVASAARPTLEASGGLVEREEAITAGGAEALRVNYRVPTPGNEFTGLQVVVDAGDGAFVLTFQTDSSGEDAAVVDEIVASITLE